MSVIKNFLTMMSSELTLEFIEKYLIPKIYFAGAGLDMF